MAKLSARGRVELLRAEKTVERGDDAEIARSTHKRAIMSDGRILATTVTWWKPDAYSGGRERRYGGRWSEYRRLKGGKKFPPEALRVMHDAYLKAGWTVEVTAEGRAILASLPPRDSSVTGDTGTGLGVTGA